MKHSISALLLALLLLLSCAACGGTAGESEDTAGDSTASATDTTDTTADDDAADTADAADATEEAEEAEAGTEDAAETTAESVSGVLTADEVAALEARYGMTQEELLADLSLDEEGVGSQDEVSLALSQERIVAGASFLQRYDFSTADPTGMYSLVLTTGLPADTEGLVETVQAIYDDAAAQYGEPTTYEGMERLSDQLASAASAADLSGVEDWTVSEGTTCRLSVTAADDLVVIALTYQMVVN